MKHLIICCILIGLLVGCVGASPSVRRPGVIVSKRIIDVDLKKGVFEIMFDRRMIKSQDSRWALVKKGDFVTFQWDYRMGLGKYAWTVKEIE